MLPEPLHPAVVHFPVVLAVLLPVAALTALFAIRRGSPLRRTWSIPLGLALALTVSAWVSVRTGAAQEDRVEEVVPREAIHTHEERAERFLVLSGAVLVVLAGGMLGGMIGPASRLVGSVGAVLLLVPAVQVGSSGGALVYEYGAAQVYVTDAPQPTGPAQPSEVGADDPDREE
jgi:hypothetical protein